MALVLDPSILSGRNFNTSHADRKGKGRAQDADAQEEAVAHAVQDIVRWAVSRGVAELSLWNEDGGIQCPLSPQVFPNPPRRRPRLAGQASIRDPHRARHASTVAAVVRQRISPSVV